MNFTGPDHIQFIPYIETTPIEAYAHVGMYKEQQLQEGRAKVQGYIDSITGLPIAKPEDKQYIQDKLFSLKSSITKNLSGDFSDQRLVSQIGGAAKQIYSDPIVQNAVAGSMAMKAGDGIIEEWRKTGKSNAANETVWNDQKAQWLSDGQQGSKYTNYFSTPTPYTDRTEMFLKYWKDANPSDRLDIADYYYYDKKLVTSDNPEGRGINPTIFKGKSPAQVQAVWDLVNSNANARQQAEIDGKYQYRGATPGAMYHQLGSSTEGFINNNNKTILVLQAKAAVGDKDAANQIQQLKEINLQADSKLASYAEGLRTNPDGVKASLVNEQMLHSLIGSYSSQVIEENPLWKTSMEQAKTIEQIRQWQANMDFEKEKFAWQKNKDVAELALKQAKLKEEEVGGIPSPIPIGDEAFKSEQSARQNIVTKQEEYTQSVREAIYTQALAGNKPPPYYLDQATGKWEVNAGAGRPYTNKAEADGVGAVFFLEAKKALALGTITGPVVEKLNNSELKYNNLEAAKNVVKEVEGMYASKIKALPKNVQEIVNKYVNQTALSPEEQVKKISNDLSSFSLPGLDELVIQMAKNIPIMKEKEEEYKRRQSSQIGIAATIRANKAEQKEETRSQFSSILSGIDMTNSTSSEGDYKLLADALVSTKDAKTDDNQYIISIDPNTNQGKIGIMRGSSLVQVDVPAKEIQRHFPWYQQYSAFRDKFQSSLDLNRGITTNSGGYPSATMAPQPITSPYIVKYDVNSVGNGQYSLRWYVASKPKEGQDTPPIIINGEILGEEYGIPNQMTPDQIISTVNQLSDKNFIEQRLILNKKIKDLINGK